MDVLMAQVVAHSNCKAGKSQAILCSRALTLIYNIILGYGNHILGNNVMCVHCVNVCLSFLCCGLEKGTQRDEKPYGKG